MELTTIHRRVIGLDIHQAQITACATVGESDGTKRIEQRQFSAFKRDRRALAEWAASLKPDQVVMESTGRRIRSSACKLYYIKIDYGVNRLRPVINQTMIGG